MQCSVIYISILIHYRSLFLFSPQDDYPLASLPLLGYSITIPSESENIHKDYVFKLHFKSHIYYFRTESEYSFERYRGLSPTHTHTHTHAFAVFCVLSPESGD